MSLIERYFKEREGEETIYFEKKGFMMYKIEALKDDEHSFNGLACIITATYVLPQFRTGKISHKLALHVEKIAKARGVKQIFCQSDENSNGWSIAHNNILKYGFREYDSEDTPKNIHNYHKEVF